MGASNGTYVPWHEPVWSHAKTKRAAAVLEEAKVPSEYAGPVVGRALHALSCWALRDGDTGAIGRLSDGELAQIAWPEAVAKGRMRPAAIGSLIRRALHAGGLLVGDGHDEAIHDFRDHNRRVLADRERRREEREGPRTVRNASVDSPQTVRGPSTTSPRLARASGSEAERQRDNSGSTGADTSATAAPPALPADGSVGAASKGGGRNPAAIDCSEPECFTKAVCGPGTGSLERTVPEPLCELHYRATLAPRPHVENAWTFPLPTQTRRRPATVRPSTDPEA